MSTLKIQAGQIRQGLLSAEPYIPAIFFYTAQATSLTDTATRYLREEMLRQYGEDIVAPSAPNQAMSAGVQYETNLLPHAEYITFHEADSRIMRHHRQRLKDLIGGHVLFDLGFGNGDTTTELVDLTRPGQYLGVDILSGIRRPLEIRLGKFLNIQDIRTWQSDFYTPDYWKDIRGDFERARSQCGRIVMVDLGLGIGNAGTAQFADLLEYIRPGLQDGDVLFFSNDATGTYGRAKYDIAGERERLRQAYNPRGSRPCLHYVAHVAFKIAGLEPLDHRKATAHIEFDEDTSSVRRRLVLHEPQPLTLDMWRHSLGTIKDGIELMRSYKRSLEEMRILAKCRDMRIDPENILTDPDRRTRISWIPFSPKSRRYVKGAVFNA